MYFKHLPISKPAAAKSRARLLAAALAVAVAAPAIAAPQAGLRQPGEPAAATLQRLRALASLPKTDGFPTIIAGKIATASVRIGRAPALPEVDVKYRAPDGLAGLAFGFLSPSGRQIIELDYNAAAPDGVGGEIKVQNSSGGALGLYTESGTWQLFVAEIVGFNGETNYYTPDQLAQLFPSLSLNMVNPNTPDTTAPSVTSGTLLTPSVSLGAANPYAAVQLGVTDDVSGTASGGIYILSPNQQYYELTGIAARPARTGSVLTGLNIAGLPHPHTGTWTIVGYTVSDAAGNVYSDFQAADIQALLGTTTFEVTK